LPLWSANQSARVPTSPRVISRARSGAIVRSIFVIVALCLLLPVGTRADGSAAGATHALLINGGHNPESNYLSHLNHLQDLVAVLLQRGLPLENIHIFSADGEEDTPDLAVRETQGSRFWIIDGTPTGRALRPRTELTNTRWAEMTLYPARKAALREWFETLRHELVPGDRLLVFVTDHGTENREDPDNGAISLWEEELTVRELEQLVALLPRGVQTVMVMSQCYSGTFASLIYEKGPAQPSGDVCGFFSTTRELRAYGCYPEGRDRDRIGHAFNFIDALGHQPTTVEAHVEVLVTDDTPDVPLRTSGLYLERIVSEEAEARGLGLGDLVDALLAEAWQDRAVWERQIRLLDRIGEVFGTFSPRSLSELEAYERELPSLIDRMRTFSDRWEMTLNAVKDENLAGFASDNPEWRERLEQQVLRKLSPEERTVLREDLLPQLESHARGQPALWSRIESLRSRTRRASDSRWRLEIREAALHRMRMILVAIAGQVLLAQETESKAGTHRRVAQRQAYERLAECESFEPGELPASLLRTDAPEVKSFPPLAVERQLMEEILPSWLGVRFRSVPEAVRSENRVPEGASWLEVVFPDSPAAKAGLQAQDVILGPPDRPFTDAVQLREWTMTSPRGTPLRLRVARLADDPEEDSEFEATLVLEPLPVVWPELPAPPLKGDLAPALPSGLRPVGSAELPDLVDRPHLLFFWATWCKPCKEAVPEVLAFAAAEGLPVIAISDETTETVAGFLKRRQEDFFEWVAVDPLRQSFITYGVSGTPTLILVDKNGRVRHRQVGYRRSDGLSVDGWSWP